MEKDNRWGGSAAAKGMNFQAAATAIAMVHMCQGSPLLWLQNVVDDTPVCVLAESGAAGDDIRLHLKDGSVAEVQVKVRLGDTASLWSTLLGFAQAVQSGQIGYGILLVGPNSPGAVREQLAHDIIRLAQGRDDDLKAIGRKLRDRLQAQGFDVASVCARLRIVTLHSLEVDSASVSAARAQLLHLTSTPGAAWEALYADAHKLIEYRGARTSATTLQMLAAARVPLHGAAAAPLMATERLLAQRMVASASFGIPRVPHVIALEEGWIPLKLSASRRFAELPKDLESALEGYHGWKRRPRSREDSAFDGEATGWFVHPCVVVAGPGMGKSTLLKRLVRSYAADGQLAFLARLSSIARRMERGHGFEESLLQLSVDGTGVTPGELASQGMSRLTFLLDGLDECGSLQDAVAQGLLAFAAAQPGTRFVVTTRPIGYDTAHLAAWQHYDLLPLEPQRGGEQVMKILGALQGVAPAKREDALQFARREIGRGALIAAIDTPQMAAMLAALAFHGLRPGASRAELYGQLFRLFADAQDPRIAQPAPAPAVRKRFIQVLGWAAIAFPTADRDALMAECARQLARELAQPPLAARALCETCCDWWEMVGMVERVRFGGEEAVTFVHKTFGEYCAALYLADLTQPELAESLHAAEALTTWSEAIDFAAALGVAPAAVEAALRVQRRGRQRAEAVERALRWASRSPTPLTGPVAAQLVQASWGWAAAPNAQLAARVGLAMTRAAPQVPAVADAAQELALHSQPWTRLTAWGCLLACRAQTLNTRELLDWVNRQLGERTEHGDHRALWQETLLLAVKLLASRGLEPGVKEVLQQVRQSPEMTVGAIMRIGELLAEAGVELQPSEFEQKTAAFWQGSLSEHGSGQVCLLQSLLQDGETADPGVMRPGAPAMHLSALLSAANLWEQSAGEMGAWTDPGWSRDAGAVLRSFVPFVRVHPGRLRREVQERLERLRAHGEPRYIFEGVVHVDVRPAAPPHPAVLDAQVLKAGLHHRSDWIVGLATQMILWSCDAAAVRAHAQDAFLGSGTTLWAACELAASLGCEEGAALIWEHAGRAAKGLHFLFDKLSNLHAQCPVEPRLDLVERALLSDDVHAAQSAARLLCVTMHTDVPALAALAQNALEHWERREPSYPSFGIVPQSARGELLQLLVAAQSLPTDLALRLAADPRPDVHAVAREHLLAACAAQPKLIDQIIAQTRSGDLDPGTLRFLLERAVALAPEQLEAVLGMLQHPSATVRAAAQPVLSGSYLVDDSRRALAGELTQSHDEDLRQLALRVLDES